MSAKDLDDLVPQLPSPFILLGDFNGHSILWGSKDINDKGRIIENFIDNHGLCLYITKTRNKWQMSWNAAVLNKLHSIIPDGSLKKVRARFARSREVNLTRWNDDAFIHINGISKCFAPGSFDRSKIKSITMKWEEVEKFRDTFSALVPHVQQMKAEMVSPMCLFLSSSDF